MSSRASSRWSDLARQLRRAVASIVSNIDEANGVAGGRRREHFLYALGSAREVTSQLRLAHDWGYLADIAAPLALLDRVHAMLWRLTGGGAAA